MSSRAPGHPGPRWSASSALVALLSAIMASLLTASLIAALFVAGGTDADQLDSTPGFTLTGTIFQEVAFVAAALIAAAQVTRPTPSQFGLGRVSLSMLGWAAVAFFGFLAIAQLYGTLVDIPTDDLPFAEHPTTLVAVITGIFVIGIAPPVEEFFFRGFLYQALRGRFGVAAGAIGSGLLFGVVHLEAPVQMGLLAILGVILALLFQRTGSLWPCILVHATNNAFAFQYVLTH